MQTNGPLEEIRKNIWLVDSKVSKTQVSSAFIKLIIVLLLNPLFLLFQGLIVKSRKESLQHFKKPWAHEHEPVTSLLDAVNV